MSDKYHVNCELVIDRVDDRSYAKLRKETSKWEPVAYLPESYCGNIYTGLGFDVKTSKFKFYKDALAPYSTKMVIPSSEVMPSALWLYRLLCAFQCTVHSEGPDGYKLVWQIALRHTETGEVIVFREWKGAFSLGHPASSRKGLPKAFLSDLLKLLTVLASKDCPHPYDGTVAGSVA